MEQAIYYPGFEVEDHNWLKFALLYVDQLNPIIPYAGDKYLSDLCNRLCGETDLIQPHRPDYKEGCQATLDAIDLTEKILRRPAAYSGAFGVPNVAALWKSSRCWLYTLFEDKYTPVWADFCLKNGLARRSQEGLLLERSLGLLYMSLLAHIISEARGTSPLTDNADMDQISVITRRAAPLTLQRIHVARGILKLQIPVDLANIDINRVIEHRGRPEFKTRLHAFHTELATWMGQVEKGEATGDFFSTRGSGIGEFSDDLMKLGAGLTAFGLGVWLLMSKPATTPSYLKELAAAGVITIGSIVSLRSTWNNTKTKRFTRKYLATLKRLK
jgi:hypothetical protein